MPKRSRKDVEDQLAALQSELDGMDDDDELWVERSDGVKAKLTGRHRTGFLESLGLGEKSEPAEGDGQGEPEGQGEGEGEPDPQPRASVWGRR